MAISRFRLPLHQSYRPDDAQTDHSAEILCADALADREAEGDGLVTNQPTLAIGVRTADCVPILLLDSVTRAVAAVHAGWRGTAASIVRQAVSRLQIDYGSRPDDLHVAIGPSVRGCCYEVSPEVAANFTAWPVSMPNPAPSGKPHIDLAIANHAQLLALGIPDAQLHDCGLCTACHPDRFFSFRREPHNPGRMLSVISRLF